MKILAASLLDSFEGFLHAGYISAQPSSQWPTTKLDVLTTDSFPSGKVPELSLDVAESLRLQGERLAAAAMDNGVANGTDARWGLAALGALGIVAAFYLAGQTAQRPVRARRSLFAMAAATALAMAAACNDADPAGPQALPAQASGGSGTSMSSQQPSTQPASTEAPAQGSGGSPTSSSSEQPSTQPTIPEAPAQGSGGSPTSSLSEQPSTQPTTPEPPPEPPAPWDGVERREYANPEQATRVILHGIIGSALALTSGEVSSMVELRDKVQLPVLSPTEGEAYALKTYAFDGWGRELRLVSGTQYHKVTSSGADGVFDNADDLILQVPRPDKVLPKYSTDKLPIRDAWYVVSWNQIPYVLFPHTASSGRTCGSSPPCYEYQIPNAAIANSISGSAKFGAFDPASLPAPANKEVPARYDEIASTVTYKPLVLVVFNSSST